MSKTLGIDLGTSSLGWAILDFDLLHSEPFSLQAPSPIDCGVIIFPEGMERDKSGSLKSRAAERRAARAARRLIFRRKWRKILLLQALAERGMCPISRESIAQWKKGHYPVNDLAFRQWLAATPECNPYIDRKRAVEEVVDPNTLGRALYHIAQRRGFKSSRKEQLMERMANSGEESADQKTDNEAACKDLGIVKADIQKLTEAMGERTLGQYFYDLYASGEKIRGRHTGRKEHYEKEFDRIEQVQGLDPETARVFRKILFFQRPLRSQSHRVGWCELERKHKYHRAHTSHPIYEEFAAWGFINAIRIKQDDGQTRPLSQDERLAIFECLKRRSPLTVESLQAALKKQKIHSLDNTEWTHRSFTRVPVMTTTAQFSALGLPEDEWQTAFNALIDFDDLDRLAEWAHKRYPWDDKKIQKFLCTNPSEDRGRFSLYALRKILPWLRKGFLNHKAFFFAKLPDIIPNFSEHADEIIADLNDAERAYHEEKRLRSEKKFPSHSPLLPLEEGYWKVRLLQHWGVTEEAYAKLYIQEECDTSSDTLPPIDLESYQNPLATRALTILRRLINRLRKEGKIDSATHIHVELTHQINSSNECRAIEKYQKAQAEKRAHARDELEKCFAEYNLQVAVSDDLILRYLLWEEQENRCPYTGRNIGFQDMALHCDIEHTVPRSLGGTSKMENLTLCDRHYNRDIKKARIPSLCPNAEEQWLDPTNSSGQPYPALNQTGTVLNSWKLKLIRLEKELHKRPVRGDNVEAYNAKRQNWLVRKMERDYLAAKIGFFEISQEKIESTSFMPRQLVDTGAITSRAVEYLRTRYPYVYSTNGAATAFARKAWGLQQKDEAKDRSDHTHHAVDAMVIAALSLDQFNRICSFFKHQDHLSSEPTITPPCPHFAERVHQAQESILVRSLRENRQLAPFSPSAKRNGIRLTTPIRHSSPSGEIQTITSITACGSTVRGSLHNDTLYGRITLPGTSETVTVLRKTLFGAPDIEKIAQDAVDPAVRKILSEQIQKYRQQGIAANKLSSQPYWLNEEKKVPLKKVRIRMTNPANPTPIRNQVFGGHTPEQQKVYISGIDSLDMHGWKNNKGKWQTERTSLLHLASQNDSRSVDSAALASRTEFILFPGQYVLAFEKSPDELFSMPVDKLTKRLYIVNNIDNDKRVFFRYHRETRSVTMLKAELPSMRDVDSGKQLSKSGESTINYKHPNPLLRLGLSTFAEHLLFEGRDFRFTLTGKIEWIRHNE